MSLQILTEMSHKYGMPDYVLGGGGNTSLKEEGVMYAKSSGTELATILPNQFVALDLKKIRELPDKAYPENDDEREAAALRDIMAARLPGEEAKRPSVETLLHGLFPYKYVLHTHPALVNGLTCAVEGEAACSRLFGSEVLWIPLTKPGYILARVCRDAFRGLEKPPQLVMLQNHGLFAAADSLEEIDELMDRVMTRVRQAVKRFPELDHADSDRSLAAEIAPALRMLYDKDGRAAVKFCANKLTEEFLRDANSIAPLTAPFTPDHIVYCKDAPLILKADGDVAEAFESFRREKGYAPKIVAVPGLGFFALGKTLREAQMALYFFLDAMQIAVYAQSFGGELTLPEDYTNFILSWEAESYRSKVSLGDGQRRRVEGKIAIVTGAAQGFGKGIARELAQQGAYVAIADLNLEGARSCAEEMEAEFGKDRFIALEVDVSNQSSVEEMVNQAVLAFGGLDIMVSNAGILFAGALPEMSYEKFMLVTKVNYAGYFLCAKYACEPMKIQNRFSPQYMSDIIEINSKSGLEGSNKNFAYAGSKFGGVGLTQSFALELVEFGIKVNAVCPGNLLDGPLWSDPDRGLFRQYLDTGKVPGAKTIADVRKFYEAKVPMKRGCTPEDVALAIFYIVEQRYETGQAVPVTGGQIMLN